MYSEQKLRESFNTVKDAIITYECNTLAPCIPAEAQQCTAEPAFKNGAVVSPNKKKKDTNMSRIYDEDLDAFVEVTPISDTYLSRSWLDQRVDGIARKIDVKLERQFGVRDDEPPKTFADVLARLTSGKYVIEDSKKNRESYDSLNYVQWRDPSIKRDDVGYKLAAEALRSAKTLVLDAVKVLDPKDALAPVQAFEKWTYVPATV